MPRSSPLINSPEPSAPVTGHGPCRVTPRAIAFGLALTIGLSWLNCFIETESNVHFLGGVQLPGGAVFVLMLFAGWNLAVRALATREARQKPSRAQFTAAELLTVYIMLLFAALISTPGTHNFIVTTGPTLFYYSTRQNGWANLFYAHIPSWWAPGWDGARFQSRVIDPLYMGGLSAANVPWHAWIVMLVAWSIFLLLLFGNLLFVALLLRRQWIESESLSFPLVQLPLQMVDVTRESRPDGKSFWTDRFMWGGFGIACFLHLVRGLSNFYPNFPAIGTFQGNTYWLTFPDRPWNAIGSIPINLYLGVVALTYLLTRELAFSFWFFYLVSKFELVLADQLGFVSGALPRDSYSGQPVFLAYQSGGGWFAVAGLLIWSMRRPVTAMFRAALRPGEVTVDEPFSPRFVFGGFAGCFAALIAWCLFAGMNLFVALDFMLLYLVVSIVIARLVVEGGFLFPQVTFAPVEIMTNVAPGYSALGAAQITKLAFLQPAMFGDMRTSPLPAFLHTFKVAHELKLDAPATRRLTGAAALSVAVSLVVTLIVSVTALYSHGGLSSYGWFASGSQGSWKSAADVIARQPSPDANRILWMVVGAAMVYAMMAARSRFLWFPFHPLAYIMAPSYPMNQMWFSIFAGWCVKSLVVKYGGHDGYVAVRPLMIGIILGNLAAMVFWMLFGFWQGTQIAYFPG